MAPTRADGCGPVAVLLAGTSTSSTSEAATISERRIYGAIRLIRYPRWTSTLMRSSSSLARSVRLRRRSVEPDLACPRGLWPSARAESRQVELLLESAQVRLRAVSTIAQLLPPP